MLLQHFIHNDKINNKINKKMNTIITSVCCWTDLFLGQVYQISPRLNSFSVKYEIAKELVGRKVQKLQTGFCRLSRPVECAQVCLAPRHASVQAWSDFVSAESAAEPAPPAASTKIRPSLLARSMPLCHSKTLNKSTVDSRLRPRLLYVTLQATRQRPSPHFVLANNPVHEDKQHGAC